MVGITERILGIRVTTHIERHIVEIVDTILLTCLTPSQAKFQLVNPSDILHEWLIVDFPSQGSCWEVAPFLSLAET